jgi:hypothetical protein
LSDLIDALFERARLFRGKDIVKGGLQEKREIQRTLCRDAVQRSNPDQGLQSGVDFARIHLAGNLVPQFGQIQAQRMSDRIAKRIDVCG